MDSLPQDEKRARINAFFENHPKAHLRMFLGRSQNGAVSLRLADEAGRDRLVVEVAADGTAALRFLDEQGQEVARFPSDGGGP